VKQSVVAWVLRASAFVLLAGAVEARADDLETAVRQAYPTNEGLLTQTTTSAVARLFLGFKVPEGASLRVESAIENRANWFVETHLLSYLSEAGYTAYLARPGSRTQQPSEFGPDTATKPLPPIKPKPSPGSLSAALDSSSAMAHTREAGDSVLAAADSASTPDTLVTPPTEPEPETAAPLNIAESEGPEADYVLRYRIVLCELNYPEKHRTSPLGSQKVERRASVSLVAQLMQGSRQDVVWVGKGSAQQVSVVPAGKLNYLAGTDFPFNPPPLEQKGMGGYVEPMLVTGIVAGLIYLFYANQN
jgi:hypothetical protein